MKWHLNDETMIDKWRNSGQMQIKSKLKLACYLSSLLSLANIRPKMAEHLKTSEAELNELLAEYWKLRHETGIFGSRRPTVDTDLHAQMYIWKLSRTN
jgi:hypothetical protein